MKYAKPEFLDAAVAFAAIQSTTKNGSQHLDNFMHQTWSNPPAYEADE